MAADFNGAWIVTQGRAYVSIFEDGVVGKLVYEDDGGNLLGVYADFSGSYIWKNEIALTVNQAEIDSFELRGQMFELNNDDPVPTIALTDGTTVLGITRQR